MNFSEFHRGKILSPERLEDERQAYLFDVIADGFAREEALRTYDAMPKAENLLESDYDRLKCFEGFAKPEAIDAHHEIVESSTRLVKFVTSKYVRLLEHIDEDDLMQEGWVALSVAAWQYDPEKGARFGTYAVPRIMSRVDRVLAAQNHVLKVPSHVTSAARTVRKHIPEAAEQSKTTRHTSRIASLLGSHSVARSVGKYESTFRHVRSLDESFGRPHVEHFDHDGQPVKHSFFNDISGQLLTNTHQEMEDEVEWAIDIVEFSDYLLENSGLTEREKRIVMLRNGYFSDEPLTLEEVGKEIGPTRERIRQIEIKAHTKMSERSRHYSGVNWKKIRAQRAAEGRQEPVTDQDAWDSLKDNQARIHAWGNFMVAVCGPWEPGKRHRSERDEKEGEVISVVRKLYGYIPPEEEHKHIASLRNTQRGAISVKPLPDVRDLDVVKEILKELGHDDPERVLDRLQTID